MTGSDADAIREKLNAIQDPILKMKVTDVPNIVASIFGGDLAGKRILDFGAGFGYTAWALAMLHEPAYVAGVDIFPEYLEGREVIRSEIGLDWPDNLKLRRIPPGERIGEGQFDFIYSWSVFEHVDLEIMDEVISDLYASLVPGGHFMMQIAPLYHSREGAHLWEVGLTNHEHLLMPIGGLQKFLLSGQAISSERGEDLWDMFSMLNRVTPQTLKRYFVTHGFEVVWSREDQEEGPLDPILLETFPESVLRTNQIVLLLRRPEPS